MSFKFDASDFLSKLSVTETKVLGATLNSMQDATDDLKRISSEIAPIDESPLRKSVKSKVELNPTGVIGEVSFSVIEKSGNKSFNYALWTHEMEYELGDQSLMAPGTTGYEVGNKYLERPLQGEAHEYMGWWNDAIMKAIEG